MMVYRRHFENALPGQLITSDLKHHRQRFENMYKPENVEQSGTTAVNCKRRGKTAEKKRTRITHKYLCGIKIEYQKTHKPACRRCRSDAQSGVFRINGQNKEHNDDNKIDRAGESVYSVSKICTVYIIYNG